LALPYDLEKEGTASALDRLGVVLTLNVGLTAAGVSGAIDTLLVDGRYANHAAVCAQSILARPPFDALETIVAECLGLLD
jgi:UDP:flavonoid glycosyltransferase YjiC (YdhE family)